MVEVIQTNDFKDWLEGLRDRRAAVRVMVRIDRLAAGNPGDVKPVGEGVSELRITYGPGYRVYFIQQGDVLIVLLTGGDKSTQDKDISKARALANEWRG